MIEFFKTLLINVLVALLAWAVKGIARYCDSPHEVGPVETPSRKTLYRQFLGFLFFLMLCCSVLFLASVPQELRILAGIGAGFSFLAVWGAFDIAMLHYPPDQPEKKIPREQSEQSNHE